MSASPTLEQRLADTRTALARTTPRERADLIGWTPGTLAARLGVSTGTGRDMLREHRPDGRVSAWLLTLAAGHETWRIGSDELFDEPPPSPLAERLLSAERKLRQTERKQLVSAIGWTVPILAERISVLVENEREMAKRGMAKIVVDEDLLEDARARERLRQAHRYLDRRWRPSDVDALIRRLAAWHLLYPKPARWKEEGKPGACPTLSRA